MPRATFVDGKSKQKFTDQTCLLGINVYQQPKHVGDNLAAISKLLDDGQFNSCYVLVGDCINRFRLALEQNYTPDEYTDLIKQGKEKEWSLYQQAIKLGEDWVRNQGKHLHLPQDNIFYCKDLRNDERFADVLQLLESLQQEKSEQGDAFRQSLAEAAHIFLDRYARRLPEDAKKSFNQKNAKFFAYKYLMEEYAIITLLAVTIKPNFFAYPSEKMDALIIAKNYILSKLGHSPKDMLQWLKIKVNSRVNQEDDLTEVNRLKIPPSDENVSKMLEELYINVLYQLHQLTNDNNISSKMQRLKALQLQLELAEKVKASLNEIKNKPPRPTQRSYMDDTHSSHRYAYSLFETSAEQKSSANTQMSQLLNNMEDKEKQMHPSPSQ